MRGAIASIGIVKGQPFAPDARMKKLLGEAATLANATARAMTYQPRIGGVRIYPDNPKSVWSTAFANKNTSFEADGAMNLDAPAPVPSAAPQLDVSPRRSRRRRAWIGGAAITGAVARAISGYQKQRWSALRRRVMRQDVSWDRPARRFQQLYRA